MLGGRDPSQGLDCLGAVYVTLQRFGLDIGQFPSVFDEAMALFQRQLFGGVWRRVDETGCAIGDVLMMKTGSVKQQHVGVLVEPTGVLHAIPSHGCIIQNTVQLRAIYPVQRWYRYGSY